MGGMLSIVEANGDKRVRGVVQKEGELVVLRHAQRGGAKTIIRDGDYMTPAWGRDNRLSLRGSVSGQKE